MASPETTPVVADSEGVRGQDPTGADMVLYRRAVKEHWPITPETRQLVVSQMTTVLTESADNRDKVAAAKVLIAADAINAKREDTDKPQVSINAGPLRITMIEVREHSRAIDSN